MRLCRRVRVCYRDNILDLHLHHHGQEAILPITLARPETERRFRNLEAAMLQFLQIQIDTIASYTTRTTNHTTKTSQHPPNSNDVQKSTCAAKWSTRIASRALVRP